MLTHQSLDLLGSTSRTHLVNRKNVPNPTGDARWYIPPLRLEIVYHWWVYPLVIKPSHIFWTPEATHDLFQCQPSLLDKPPLRSRYIQLRWHHSPQDIPLRWHHSLQRSRPAHRSHSRRRPPVLPGLPVRNKIQCRWSGIYRESGSRWYVFIFACLPSIFAYLNLEPYVENSPIRRMCLYVF